MQNFSIDWVDENFVYLQISTKITTPCDGSTRSVVHKISPVPHLCSGQTKIRQLWVEGQTSSRRIVCREMPLSSKLWETGQSYESQQRTALDYVSS